MMCSRTSLIALCLLASALATPVAWADAGGEGPRLTAVADPLDAELNRELGRVSAPDSSNRDVLAEAKQFYRRLRSTPDLPARPARTSRSRQPQPQPAIAVKTPAPSGKLLKAALKYKGVPYVWGGASKKGVDCSGLVVKAAAELGHPLPHSAALLYQHGTPVPKDQLRAGDLVFFANTYKPGISHVGIYAGGSKFLQASSGKGRVTFGDLNSHYYLRKYAGAKRLGGLVEAAQKAVSFLKGAGRTLWAPFRLD